ncbi:MAG: DUF2680 domain-containing protein [Chloroflexi bacterium]|nr:DUF2680 domain-containing protein [Chloroflexota bacterium]
MFKRILVLVTTLAAIAIVGAALVGTVLADDPTTTSVPFGPRGGHGPMDLGGPAWGGQSTLDAVSQLLGLTPEQIHEQRLAGKSLAQIAQEKGVSEAKLIETILAAKKAVLDSLVSAGKLTQAQADAMYAHMQTQVPTAVERTSVGPANGRGNAGNCPGLNSGQQNPGMGMGPGSRGGRFGGRFQAPATPGSGN